MACVLDYCLLEENVHCRSRKDCPGEYCILHRMRGEPNWETTPRVSGWNIRSICESDFATEGDSP